MQITLNYTYNQDQLKRAYRFNVFPTPKAKFFLFFFSCVIFGVGGVYWLWKPASISPLLLTALKNMMLAACLIWVSVLLAVALNYFYLPVYAFEKSPFFKGDFTVSLTTEGLAYHQRILEENNKRETDGFVKWTAFTKKAENDEFIVLYIGRKHSIIPKTSFQTTAELENFRWFLMEQKRIKTKKFNGKEIWNNS
ncbi:YcxB family protein [Pedobacter agri]|uniref:YcxB family protein n=1 Tax=Pedobacter agri TaxID=454586 RepID=UPI00292CB46B|nr:YcxB family protein [Pedobacter agri]